MLFRCCTENKQKGASPYSGACPIVDLFVTLHCFINMALINKVHAHAVLSAWALWVDVFCPLCTLYFFICLALYFSLALRLASVYLFTAIISPRLTVKNLLTSTYCCCIIIGERKTALAVHLQN